MKKTYIIFLVSIIFIISLNLIGFNLLKSHNLKKKYYNTKGARVVEELKSKNVNEEEKNSFKRIPYNLSFYLKNNKMNFNKNILYKNNRFYIPLSEFLSYFGNKEEVDKDDIIIKNLANIDLNKKTYEEDNKITDLRGDILKEDNEYYISFFDLCEILKLNTYWDYEKNSIYISKKTLTEVDKEKQIKRNKKKKAFIRFEDFTAGDVYITKGALEKVRKVADYMNENKESFSVAWVPRYINNTYNIDNDVSKKDSIQNSNFIFTLDYLLNRGGNVGLHGYTHQYKDTNSISGFEFGDDGYKDEKEIRTRVENALKIANKVNIPISFWETPHYRTTHKQQEIFEEYFKIIYEPSIGIYNKNIITSKINKVTKYIPTPMGYVDDDDGKAILSRIRNKRNNEELSLFYHLSVEIKDVDISIDKNGEINYKYNENSILKQIVNCVESLGYEFGNIKDL
ncbi:DUF2334 domain-containing protein [Clostridium sp. C8]|uniref:DUF2334 domain-containing protein n=1 Tax=Clostridium sp. C8 TaxID=1667357 RepID=UPI0006995528|nr:DUF2334 domain-containing protein [Clostridium sp. C8]